jgi:hypothetical protein
MSGYKTVEMYVKPLVKVYLLCARLPSKYLVQEMRSERTREVRQWTGDRRVIASRIEGIRAKAYEMLRRCFAYVVEYGTWIAVTDEAVEEARRVWQWVVEELKKANVDKAKPGIALEKRYEIEAVPIYLEPEHAKKLLLAAITHLSQDAEELEKRIREAEQKRKRGELNKLTKRYSDVKNLLDKFKNFYSSIDKK